MTRRGKELVHPRRSNRASSSKNYDESTTADAEDVAEEVARAFTGVRAFYIVEKLSNFFDKVVDPEGLGDCQYYATVHSLSNNNLKHGTFFTSLDGFINNISERNVRTVPDVDRMKMMLLRQQVHELAENIVEGEGTFPSPHMPDAFILKDNEEVQKVQVHQLLRVSDALLPCVFLA